MRFLLAQHYAGPVDVPPIWEWAPDDVTAHIEWQQRTNDDLVASGELVDAQALAGPEAVRIVRSTGPGSTQIIDGPFPESKEFLAGYRIVDVESERGRTRSPPSPPPARAPAAYRWASTSKSARSWARPTPRSDGDDLTPRICCANSRPGSSVRSSAGTATSPRRRTPSRRR